MLVCSPVGATPEERQTGEIPPGNWYCSNAFGNYYQLKPGVMAYHTGADLLLWPGGGAHEPIYAIADGVITFAARIVNSTWGNIIVIRHDMPDGSHVYSRYGHVENMLVAPGDNVTRGQQIAQEGNAYGQFAYHLHFDISPTERLARFPADWPGLDLERLRQDYTDPLAWIKEHRTMATTPTLDVLTSIKLELTKLGALVDQAIAAEQPVPAPDPAPAPRPTRVLYVTADPTVNVRATRDTTQAAVGKLLKGAAVTVYSDAANLGTWWQIAEGPYAGKYISAQWLSETRPS